MMRYLFVMLAVVLLAVPARADYRSLYTDDELRHAMTLYRSNLEGTFYKDLLGSLPPEIRAQVHGASIDL